MRHCCEFVGILICMLLVGAAPQDDGANRHVSSVPATQPASEATSLTTGQTVETIVFLRHGEKPLKGYGQLSPKGLNRALGLVNVLPKKFGKPDFLFAPDPRQKVFDRGGLFSYVRPLATIEPTAISLGMPVTTPFGYRDIAELNDELLKDRYAGSLIFVAWEHIYEQRAVVDLLKSNGFDASHVPAWKDDDYDSLYVIRVKRNEAGAKTLSFSLEHEGLDGQSDVMPSAAVK